MISENEKYQNIITQIHELNRQNLLNENQKIEEISKKIDQIEKPNFNINSISFIKKTILITLILLLINIFLTIFLLFKVSELDNNELKNNTSIEQEKTEVVKEDILPENNDKELQEDILSFNKESVEKFKNESFEKINPIIRKGTRYTCDGKSKIYQIPYTVEIKGRLYSDRFTFTLQEETETKQCIIKKENM